MSNAPDKDSKRSQIGDKSSYYLDYFRRFRRHYSAQMIAWVGVTQLLLALEPAVNLESLSLLKMQSAVGLLYLLQILLYARGRHFQSICLAAVSLGLSSGCWSAVSPLAANWSLLFLVNLGLTREAIYLVIFGSSWWLSLTVLDANLTPGLITQASLFGLLLIIIAKMTQSQIYTLSLERESLTREMLEGSNRLFDAEQHRLLALEDELQLLGRTLRNAEFFGSKLREMIEEQERNQSLGLKQLADFSRRFQALTQEDQAGAACLQELQSATEMALTQSQKYTTESEQTANVFVSLQRDIDNLGEVVNRFGSQHYVCNRRFQVLETSGNRVESIFFHARIEDASSQKRRNSVREGDAGIRTRFDRALLENRTLLSQLGNSLATSAKSIEGFQDSCSQSLTSYRQLLEQSSKARNGIGLASQNLHPMVAEVNSWQQLLRSSGLVLQTVETEFELAKVLSTKVKQATQSLDESIRRLIFLRSEFDD
jgi:hypothetical protein